VTRKAKNILFIMFDQLRFDYLGCAGHPYLSTPNMDWLASRGVRFSRAYVQSPVCGASRMSFYTGRYVHSHGAAYNNYPLKVGELTLGDHLRSAGMATWLIGKTHMKADSQGMDRLGISVDSIIGARLAECGFDIYLRDDGLWAEGPDGRYDERHSPYNDYLKSKGYGGDNPWASHANAGVSKDGDMASGWFMENAAKPANIRAEDSETEWLTDRAIDFIKTRPKGQPWLAHLSYIKPHWPYIVSAPYHAMYSQNQILPVNRSEAERLDPNPVLAAYQGGKLAQTFSRDEVRNVVIPAYMGLIKQCDDALGRLFEYLRIAGRMDDTMIVITSDHGDYLGDHWLGEKDMFHDAAVKVPLIVFDPSRSADSTRGSVCDALVESIDLAATFVETAGGEVPGHILEGRSLHPYLRGQSPEVWRDFAVSEYDYSNSPMAVELGVTPAQARLFMIADKNWKFVHSEGPGHPPMLFDLKNDPREVIDLGRAPDYDDVIALMYRRLGQWARRSSQRTTVSDAKILSGGGGSGRRGILLGVFQPADVDPDIGACYQGPAPRPS